MDEQQRRHELNEEYEMLLGRRDDIVQGHLKGQGTFNVEFRCRNLLTSIQPCPRCKALTGDEYARWRLEMRIEQLQWL